MVLHPQQDCITVITAPHLTNIPHADLLTTLVGVSILTMGDTLLRMAVRLEVGAVEEVVAAVAAEVVVEQM